jgi:hypothetical protein
MGAVVGVLLFARATGRLTRSSWMVNIRLGGPLRVLGSVVVRALVAFGAARIVFATFAVLPTVYLAAPVVLILLAWDLGLLRFVTRSSWTGPSAMKHLSQLLYLKIGGGVVASSIAALLFLRT